MNKLLILLAVVFIVALTAFTANQKDPKLKKIFNGKNLDGWKAPEDNIWWIASDGILSVKSSPDQKGSILWTNKTYKDFIFQADFKFGEGTVDSGVFIRNESDQIQIGESGSLKRDMTGSIYIPGKGYPVEASNVKELLKMKDWNTIKVKAVGNDYTVWLNGKQVMNYTSETSSEVGQIGLQLHPGRDMHIDYKNILLAEL